MPPVQSKGDKAMKLPDPEFQIGDLVTVIVNDRNKTPRAGTIQRIIWHHKDSRYNYYLEADGRSVSKRYFADDLKLADKRRITIGCTRSGGGAVYRSGERSPAAR